MRLGFAELSASRGRHAERLIFEINAALSACLAALTDALDEPSIDIGDSVRQLDADARLAVDSYIGLSVLIPVDGHRLGFTVLDESFSGSDPRASIALELPAALPSPRPSIVAAPVIVLYAANAGAFVDLAADLAHLLGATEESGEVITLDAHLKVATDTGLVRDLAAISTINQAVGVLVARDGTPEQVELALRLLADSSQLDLSAATAVLDELDP